MQKRTQTYGAIKALFGYLFEYKKEVVLLSILGVISALANGSVPYITGKFFDAVLTPETIFSGMQFEMPLWLFLILLWTFANILSDLVGWISENKSAWLSTHLQANYSVKGFESLFLLSISFHKNNKQGTLGDKISRAAGWMSAIVERVVIHLTPQFLSVIVGLFFVYLISPLFIVVLAIGIISYVFILIKTVSPAAKLIRQNRKIWGEAYGDAYGALSNIKEIKQSVTEKFETQNLYKQLVKKAVNTYTKIALIWSTVGFTQKVIVTITRLVIFLISVYLIKRGDLSIGDLIAINGYAGMVFGPFVQLGFQWQTIQNGLIYLEAGEKIMKGQKEKYRPEKAVELEKIKGNISFKEVVFQYEKKEKIVIDDISLDIKAGETVALVGRSGEGKSTLVDLISGYYFPNKGRVLIDGIDTRRISLNTLRKNIAVVPQEIVLFNDTVRHNIRYGSFKATDEEIISVAKEAHADEFIKKFPKKYNQKVGERGVKLSVGQKQRIAIARAILQDPKILILDEPTSALDAHNEKMINESLERLMKGRTTIIIAHRLSTVRKADKIFVFENGKVVEQGKHETLMQIENGIYRKMYELHVGLS